MPPTATTRDVRRPLRENWSRLVVPSLAVTEICHLLADPLRRGAHRACCRVLRRGRGRRTAGGVLLRVPARTSAHGAFADQFTNAVAVTMLRLRRKLGEPPLIENVVGTRIHDAVTRSSDALVRQPWRTNVRARIAVSCGGLSLVVGAALIAGTYALARGDLLCLPSPS